MKLLKKIKQLEKYLGPRVGYSSDPLPLPWEQPERWLMEYLDILKREYYVSDKIEFYEKDDVTKIRKLGRKLKFYFIDFFKTLKER